MNKSEQAMNYFENGCNCSQAVLMAYAEELDIDKDIVQRVAVTFGGGITIENLVFVKSPLKK